MKNKLIISTLLLLFTTAFRAQQTPVGNINNKSRTTIVLNFFSFNNPLTAGEMSMNDVIDYAAKVGYEGMDITGYYFKGYPTVPSDKVIYDVKRRAFTRGIPICGTGVRNNFALADPAQREKEKQLVKDWVVVAAKLGANTLRIFTGLKVPDGYTWEQTAKWIAADIDECAEFAKKYGIILAIQNHNDFLKTSDDIEHLFSMIKSGNVGLMLDIGSFRSGDPYLQIEQCVKYAITWQIKEKVFTNDVASATDLPRIMQIIRKSGYCGFVPIEAIEKGNEKEHVKDMLLRVKEARKQVLNGSLTQNETIRKVENAMLCMQRHHWEQGVVMRAAMEINDTATLVLLANESLFRQFPDGRLSMVGSKYVVGDPGLSGVGVLKAYQLTGDEKFKNAAKAQFDFFKNKANRNNSGVIYHNTENYVVFSDNMYMVAPFLARMGDFDDAMFQIEGLRSILWDKKMQLFRHIRNPQTGEYQDSTFWGGGNGWCAAAMTEIIDLLPDERTADKKKLIGYCTDLLNGCLKWQLPNGLFYDQITIPNFEESTLPMMLAYSIYTGVKSGWLPKSYLPAADKMRSAVYAKVDKFGFIKDASDAPRFNSPGYSPEAQAFFLMMESAYSKLNR